MAAVGLGDSVTMDKNQPFVGEASPRIALDGATPRGIRQSGLSVVKGKQYVGHIWLRVSPNSTVKVALIWVPGQETGDGSHFLHLTPALTRNSPSDLRPGPTAATRH